MARPADTRSTYAAVGLREDLSNVIYNISPTDTPFMSSAGRESCDSTFFEWQTDSLTAAATNRIVEGDDLANTAVAEPTRVGNYCQISGKSVATTGTAEAVDFAGRRSSQAYQLAKRAKEMKRDMEKMLMSNVAKAVPATVAAGTEGQPTGDTRITAGLGAWVKTNVATFGSGGSACAGNGGNITTDGTPRAISELLMKEVISACFSSGSNADTIMVGPFNKQAISDLTQTTSPLRTAADKPAPAHVVAAVDIYVSDFGNFKVVPNRFQQERDAWFFDFDFWAVSYLRPFQTLDIARTGDSKKQMLVAEYGLMAKNEAASGCIYDCTSS
jgi:hypothetical protein|tara:strand:- start:3025 stop:4011 length:987 start_codon:yes stop_codon:yes gene_type:complete